MDLPADGSPTGQRLQPTPAGEARRGRRRRPTGAAPPLPYRLQTSAVGWLVAAVVLVGLTLAVFGRGMRGSAIAVTVVDDAVVRWLGGLHAPGLQTLWRGLAHLGSWWALIMLQFGLLLALLVLRRWRHLIVWLVVWNVVMILVGLLDAVARRPRPFGVEQRVGWGGWAMPSMELTHLTLICVGVLYTLVPEGRWRNLGKWVAAGLVAVVAAARIALGTEAPTDVLLTVGIAVSIPLLAFRRFTPNEVFPITYRRGRVAHLDVGGARGAAIRRALEEQLGLVMLIIPKAGFQNRWPQGGTPSPLDWISQVSRTSLTHWVYRGLFRPRTSSNVASVTTKSNMARSLTRKIMRRASISSARPCTREARPTGWNGSPSKISPPKSNSFCSVEVSR
jgi:hypothetical protein